MKKFALVAVIVALLLGSLGGWALANNNATGTEADTPQNQEAVPGWIGITVGPVQEQLAWWLDLEGDVLIRKVAPDSPAEAVGLEPGDIITAINGIPVADPGQAMVTLKGIMAGDEVVFTILRKDGSQQVAVVAAEKPERPRLRILPELEGIAPQELFEHFLDGQLRFTDKDGDVHTVAITCGILVELTVDQVTIVPNGQTEPLTFTITEETIIRPQELEADSRVVVVSVDGLDEARAVLSPGALAGLKQLRQRFSQLPHKLEQRLPELRERLEQYMPELRERLRQHRPELELRLEGWGQQWRSTTGPGCLSHKCR